MSISREEEYFLSVIEREEEYKIYRSIALFPEIKRKYKNTYKGFKLLKETIKKKLWNSASILIEEICPIAAINKNTPLHIAVKHGSIQLALTLIRKGAEINVPDENEDYPIHIATNHLHYSLVEVLLQKGARIDVRDGNDETPLIRAIKLRNVILIKLFLKFDADMNNLWPNTNETLFYYLTVTNPIPNYSPPYVRMNMVMISNIIVYYLMYPSIEIRDIHILDKDVIEFIIKKNFYDLLLRFGLDKMDLPFLKYTAIIHNRIDILDKLMSYNSVYNDSIIEKSKSCCNQSEVYSLFEAAHETCNKDAYNVLEKYGYFIHDIRHIWRYLFFYNFIKYKSRHIQLTFDELISHSFGNERFFMLRELQYFPDRKYYWISICFKRRFLQLDRIHYWYRWLSMKLSLNIYANIFINMKLENVSDMWSMLKCFLSMINKYGTLQFENSKLLELYFSELIRLDYLNQLTNKTELTIILSQEYLKTKYENTKNCIEELRSIIIYENQTAFDFYLQKNRYRNVNILKKITENVITKSNSCEIPNFISIPLIKRLERTIKKEILLKKCSIVLNQLFDLPILIREKILLYYTKRELKLLCGEQNRKFPCTALKLNGIM